MKEFKTVIDGVVYQFHAIKRESFAMALIKLGAKIGKLKFSELNIIEL